jgi:hypothetical protein
MMKFAQENAIALFLVVVCTALIGHCRYLQKQITTNKIENDFVCREFGIHKGQFSQAMKQVGNRIKTTENTVVLAFELITEKLDEEHEAKASANKPASIRLQDRGTQVPLQRVDTPKFEFSGARLNSAHLDRRRSF